MNKAKKNKLTKIDIEKVEHFAVTPEGSDRKTLVTVYKNVHTAKKKYDCVTQVTVPVNIQGKQFVINVPFQEFIKADSVIEAYKKFNKWVIKNKDKRIKEYKRQKGIPESDIVVAKGFPGQGQVVNLGEKNPFDKNKGQG